jgi:hypothetical protein
MQHALPISYSLIQVSSSLELYGYDGGGRLALNAEHRVTWTRSREHLLRHTHTHTYTSVHSAVTA